MRKLRVAASTESGSSAERIATALGALGHTLVRPPDDLADLVVTDERPSAGQHHGAQVWLSAESLAQRDALAAGAPLDPTSAEGVHALLCPDATWQGLLDARGPELANRTRAAWGDPVARTARLVERAFPEADSSSAEETDRLKVVVAGHDLNFFRAVLHHLERRPDVEVRVDHLAGFADHDPARSARLLAWADTAFCEWISPLAAWYSHNKPPHVRLVVRLHRVELYNDWVDRVDISAIDQVVCVSPHYVNLTLARTGWPAEKVTCIPNYVDCDVFDRPKLPGAEHHLGVVGIVPSRKRFDLALDVLERLRDRDPRYRLFVKTKMPWEYAWNWREESEREITALLFDRIASSGLLRDAVVFDPHGADVAAWFRRIGHVLSTSDDESFHLAPAEGMASGAVPAIRDWPGSDAIYDPTWIHPSLDALTDSVDALVGSGTWAEAGRLAQAQVRESFDVTAVCRRFVTVLRGREPEPPVPHTMSAPLGGFVDPAQPVG